MKPKKVTIIILGTLTLVILWLFIDEREKSRRKDILITHLKKNNNRLKIEYLHLFEKFIISQNNVAPDVIKELQKLKTDIDNLDQKIHIELDSVIKRINDGKNTKAIKDLEKIVENNLKVKVENDVNFKNKPMLHNLLDHALNSNWISNRQYENGILLKEIRNKESHELAVKEESINVGIVIFAGIDILYSVSKINNN